MTDKQSVVIIGGGPAGLTAAWELIKDGGADKYDVTVLEGTREFGGISRTVKHNGNRMDIGGHRFFSKDERIMDWWKTVLPLQGAPSYDDKKLGRDHDILVEAYDDPGVAGVTCYVSRARIGGIKGTLGLAEDRAEASIACRQTGPLSFAKPLRQQQEIFSERMSLLFKRLRVVRMVDAPRNTLVYLSYSDKLIDGSPQNSITAVPVDRATPIPLDK